MREFVFFLILLNFSCSSSSNKSGWIGDYEYEEEPVEAQADYYMAMTWNLKIYQVKNDYKANIEINGQQTNMVIQARLEGDGSKIKLLFDRGISGNGYEDIKEGDNLFELSKKDGRLITRWSKMTPRLLENFSNDTTYFKQTK